MLKKIQTALLRFNPVTRYRKHQRNKRIIETAFKLFHSFQMSPTAVKDHVTGSNLLTPEDKLHYSLYMAEQFERIKENYFYFKN